MEMATELMPNANVAQIMAACEDCTEELLMHGARANNFLHRNFRPETYILVSSRKDSGSATKGPPVMKRKSPDCEFRNRTDAGVNEISNGAVRLNA